MFSKDIYSFHSFSFIFASSSYRAHVCGGLLHGSTAALLVLLAGQSVCGQSSKNSGKEGSGRPADWLTDYWHVVFFR